MPIDYLGRPVTRVRRRDRALTDEDWIERFLRTAPVGHVAVSWGGEPLLHSNTFWFDGEGHIYWHTAGVGKFRAVIEAAGVMRACFGITEQGRLLPAGRPFDFSTEYASVQAYGRLRVVQDLAEKRRALEGLMAKYAPQLRAGEDYEPMPDADIDQTSVFCLEIETRVGKHNVKPEDYPAYRYPGGSFIEEERSAGRTTVLPKDLA